MTIEELVAKVNSEAGIELDVERPVAEHGGWHFGERVRVLEDDEDAGAFEGDEGWLVIEQVGAAEYDNVRVMFGFLGKGFSDPIEISPDNFEAID